MSEQELLALPRPSVTLVGQDGNAFSILGRMCQAFKKVGWSKEAISAWQTEAMDGDYDHLLITCAKYADIS